MVPFKLAPIHLSTLISSHSFIQSFILTQTAYLTSSFKKTLCQVIEVLTEEIMKLLSTATYQKSF